MNPQEFYIDFPLYKKIDLSDIKYELLKALIEYQGPLKTYCKECRENSVFNEGIEPKDSYSKHRGLLESLQEMEITGDTSGFIIEKEKNTYSDKIYFKTFQCAANKEHLLLILFAIRDNKIFKYGQYPSDIDLIQNMYYQFKKFIDDRILKELRTAWILSCHNFSVASLIHIRRAFEFIMEEFRNKKKGIAGWDDAKYETSHFDEKIELLKDVLPVKLTENKSTYKILSKGVHKLSEEECKEMYDVLNGIMNMILTELNSKREIEQTEIELKKKKAEIESKHSQKK